MVQNSREEDKTNNEENSSIVDLPVLDFEFDLGAILLGYPRCAEHTERLHWHHWKVKNPTLPARMNLEAMLIICPRSHLILV